MINYHAACLSKFYFLVTQIICECELKKKKGKINFSEWIRK